MATSAPAMTSLITICAALDTACCGQTALHAIAENGNSTQWQAQSGTGGEIDRRRDPARFQIDIGLEKAIKENQSIDSVLVELMSKAREISKERRQLKGHRDLQLPFE